MTNFSSISAKSGQKGNPGGASKVAVILASIFTANWPVTADVTAGEITGSPVPKLPLNHEIAVYNVPKNTISVGSSNSGNSGFQSFTHNVTLKMAGYDKSVFAELAKHVNADCVFLVELADGTWVVAGSSAKGITLTNSTTSGTSGSDERGTTLEGEETGYAIPALPLATSVVTALTFAAIA